MILTYKIVEKKRKRKSEGFIATRHDQFKDLHCKFVLSCLWTRHQLGSQFWHPSNIGTWKKQLHESSDMMKGTKRCSFGLQIRSYHHLYGISSLSICTRGFKTLFQILGFPYLRASRVLIDSQPQPSSRKTGLECAFYLVQIMYLLYQLRPLVLQEVDSFNLNLLPEEYFARALSTFHIEQNDLGAGFLGSNIRHIL